MAADLKHQIGSRIRRAREYLGLTQSDLAARLDKDATTISNYENGNRTPHITELPDLAQILRVPIGYFFQSRDDLAELEARLLQGLAQGRSVEDPLLRDLQQLLHSYQVQMSEMELALSAVTDEVSRLRTRLARQGGEAVSLAAPEPSSPRLLTFTVEETSLQTLIDRFIRDRAPRLSDDEAGDETSPAD